jgi:lipoyl(octanoyl) transferase
MIGERSADVQSRRARVARDFAPRLKTLGRVEYRAAYEAMRRFTETREPTTPDELWLLEHPPVYTLGLAGREAHLPRGAHGAHIPVERVDRGGQITYHGPGQAIVYTLVDLERRALSVRGLVTLLEQAVIDLLAAHDVDAARKSGAPGVYVNGAKIAALGLRVRRGCSYHGVALNVAMDLAPFSAIDPCGYPGLAVTQTSALGIESGADELGAALAREIARLLEATP